MHRVLIIEDEQDIRDILSIVLTRLGYDVVAAENGKKGVDLFNNAPFFDLVITDIRMPGMSGNDVAKLIRASRKSDTPLIAITGFPDEIEKDMFDSSLQKPFSLKDFEKVIDHLTKNSVGAHSTS